jgi:hypoxanthine-DNA glycosylase
MIETNPFDVFCPKNAKYFLLGSFAAKDGKSGVEYNWYYSNGRNQFWSILESVYEVDLKNKRSQQALFKKLGIAIADIIYQCERTGNSSLDSKLSNFVYNYSPIEKVLQENPIEKILFTSRFVEKEFKKNFKDLIERFPEVEPITLPSPSPRYAAMRIGEKIKIYKQLLPPSIKPEV